MAVVATTRRVGFLTGPEWINPVKLSWGAIFGGTFVALGVWVLLYAFGLAIGLSVMEPGAPGSARGGGIFTGIWSILSPLIALFIGGFVASRTAGAQDRVSGGLHGAVLWGITTMVGVLAVGMTVSTLVTGLARLGGGVTSAVTGMQPATDPTARGGALERLGLDAEDFIAPINERLAQQGKPTLSGEEMKAVGADLARRAVRGEPVDRTAIEQSLAMNTTLSPEDARDLSAQVQQRVDSARGEVRESALQVADTTGKAFWGIFAALLFGLISSVLGALVGVTRKQQVAAGERVVAKDTTTERREVYP